MILLSGQEGVGSGRQEQTSRKRLAARRFLPNVGTGDAPIAGQDYVLRRR